MKILIVTQWFDPEPTFKGLIFAEELVRRGHSVQVLTGFPNYPGGKVYTGYSLRLLQRQVFNGVNVLRVALYPSHDNSAMRRAVNYISFALSASFAAAFLTRRADVAYIYHPPATIGAVALVLRLFRRTPVVLDIQDLWPETLAATGMLRSSLLLGVIGLWCRLMYTLASQIVVLSPGFQMRLVERGVPKRKVDVIYNWCDESALTTLSDGLANEEAALLKDRLNFVFAGNLGPAQGLDTLLDAACIVAIKHPNVQFVLVGSGLELARLRERVRVEKISSVVFLPRRPPTAMADVYAAATALIVHLRDEELFSITIPSKTQAYLRSAKPIVMGVKGDAADLVRESGAGITCVPGDPSSLAAAVCTLVDLSPQSRGQMGENGARFYSNRLSLRCGINAFERVFLRVSGFIRK